MKNILPILFTSLLLTCCGTASTTQNTLSSDILEEIVSEFTHHEHTVTVYFTDPLLQLMNSNSNFTDLTPRERATALSDYLHNNAVYRFVINGQNNNPIAQLVVEGDPDITNSAAFYRITKYEYNHSEMEKVGIEPIGIRGMLFEHMAPFRTQEGQQYIGNGIQLFEGIFMRVTPFSEVKDAVLPHITRILS